MKCGHCYDTWISADCTYPSSPTTKGSTFNLIHLSCNGSFFLQLIYCHQIAISIQINESIVKWKWECRCSCRCIGDFRLIFIHFHWNFHLSWMAGWRWTAIRISICSKYSAVKWHLSRVLSSCNAMQCDAMRMAVVTFNGWPQDWIGLFILDLPQCMQYFSCHWCIYEYAFAESLISRSNHFAIHIYTHNNSNYSLN